MKILIAVFLSIMLAFTANAQEILPLYPGAVPGNRSVPDSEKSIIENGGERISKVLTPTIQVYLPAKENANGTAVIICPGGGYARLAMTHEGYDVAKKFNEAGVAAFVLKYRLPDDALQTDKSIAPLQDAQQAIKLVRENAAKWGVKTDKVGILGFSAGGHLASTAGTHYESSKIGNTGNISLRPDFMILIYPVISFQDSLAHMGSRNNLVGKNASQADVDLYSNELQVTDNTPPTFLVHAGDDGGVPAANSIKFFEALKAHHVPAELHIYQAGGHGFGMINKTTKELWMNSCWNWMAANGWI